MMGRITWAYCGKPESKGKRMHHTQGTKEEEKRENAERTERKKRDR
jgi:hypothetical protein